MSELPEIEGSKTVTFAAFRDGMGGRVCKRLGVDISHLETWDGYSSFIEHYNDETQGAFVRDARQRVGVWSSSEFVVLLAAMTAANFAAHADALGRNNVLDLFYSADIEARVAIAAAILRSPHG